MMLTMQTFMDLRIVFPAVADHALTLFVMIFAMFFDFGSTRLQIRLKCNEIAN